MLMRCARVIVVSVCELGTWSEWTRCTGSCGNSHVQERTRVVRKIVKEYDVPCDARLERRYCILPTCPNTQPVGRKCCHL